MNPRPELPQLWDTLLAGGTLFHEHPLPYLMETPEYLALAGPPIFEAECRLVAAQQVADRLIAEWFGLPLLSLADWASAGHHGIWRRPCLMLAAPFIITVAYTRFISERPWHLIIAANDGDAQHAYHVQVAEIDLLTIYLAQHTDGWHDAMVGLVVDGGQSS